MTKDNKRKSFRIKLDPKAIDALKVQDLDKVKGGYSSSIPRTEKDCSTDHPTCDSGIRR